MSEERASAFKKESLKVACPLLLVSAFTIYIKDRKVDIEISRLHTYLKLPRYKYRTRIFLRTRARENMNSRERERERESSEKTLLSHVAMVMLSVCYDYFTYTEASRPIVRIVVA